MFLKPQPVMALERSLFQGWGWRVSLISAKVNEALNAPEVMLKPAPIAALARTKEIDGIARQCDNSGTESSATVVTSPSIDASASKTTDDNSSRIYSYLKRKI